jgi:putative Holliday junction resolvase
MRVLALDYGSARCGCALSDPTGTIAMPIEPVLSPASRRGMRELVQLVHDRHVQRVIVGLPLSLGGDDTAQTQETRAFAQQLSLRLGDDAMVELHDERFTTRLAQRTPGSRDTSEDSRAAAHLLEGWLSSQER